MATPGERLINELWWESDNNEAETFGNTIWELFNGDPNLIDLFEGMVNEDFMSRLNKIYETVMRCQDMEEGEVYGDQDEGNE